MIPQLWVEWAFLSWLKAYFSDYSVLFLHSSLSSTSTTKLTSRKSHGTTACNLWFNNVNCRLITVLVLSTDYLRTNWCTPTIVCDLHCAHKFYHNYYNYRNISHCTKKFSCELRVGMKFVEFSLLSVMKLWWNSLLMRKVSRNLMNVINQ